MSFLAPWFLIGALAIAAPILFHLIRRNTRERILFSSLMFLNPSPPRLTKRKRIENILLLLLRCAVICFVALAFGRPYFHKIFSAASAPAITRRYVLLLDTSASMRRADLWKQAQAKALGIIHELSPGDELAIVSFGGSVHTVMSFDEFGATRAVPGAAAERINALAPDWDATHLGAALIAGAEALQDRQEKLTNSAASVLAVVAISDFQEGSKLDELQHFEWPKAVQVRLEPVKAETKSNASLQLAIESEGASTNNTVRVLLANSSDSKREQFRLSWADESQANQAVAGGVDVYLVPGQKKVVQAPMFRGDGGHLLLSGDDEPFDNSLYFARSSHDLMKVSYFGNDAPEDIHKPFYYLQRAFVGGTGMAVQVALVRPANIEKDAVGKSSFVVADEELPASTIAPLRNFISSGHSMLMVLDKAADISSVQQLLETAPIPCAEAETNRYALLGQIDFQHPLFAPFADPRFSDFSKIRFWHHRIFKAETIPHSRVIARFDDDSPALVEASLGTGALYILASGWQPVESQLAVSSKFVPLLFSFLEQSSGGNEKLSRQFLVSQTVRIPPAVAEKGTVAVTIPNGKQLQVSNAVFSETHEPGIYKASAGTNNFTFAVNLDSAESRTVPLPDDELERMGLPIQHSSAAKPESRSQKTQARLVARELEQQQKLWRWGLVSALLLLSVEAWAAQRTGQPIAV